MQNTFISNNNELRHLSNPLTLEEILYLYINHYLYIHDEPSSLFKTLELTINNNTYTITSSIILKPLIKLIISNKNYKALINIYFYIKQETFNIIKSDRILIYKHSKDFTKKKPKNKVGQLIIVEKDDKIKNNNQLFIYNSKFIIRENTTPLSLFSNIENINSTSKIIAIISNTNITYLNVQRVNNLSFEEDSKTRKYNK